MNKSLTVIIPAYNEEVNLPQALEDVPRALEGMVDDYEIIVVDDGSNDRTSMIAQEKARKDPRFICIQNESNRGYGYTFLRGVKAATKEYIGVFHGDNDQSWESFREIIKNIGKADIVSLYTVNPEARPWFRSLLSRTFMIIMNLMFRMNLKYLNGCFIGRRNQLQALSIRSRGLTTLAECKIKLIRQGYTCLEFPCIHVPRQGGRSSALSFKSIKAVIEGMFLLYRDVYWSK